MLQQELSIEIMEVNLLVKELSFAVVEGMKRALAGKVGAASDGACGTAGCCNKD